MYYFFVSKEAEKLVATKPGFGRGTINVEERKVVILHACPVVNGLGPCCRNCGGGWPGTKATTKQLTEAVNTGSIDPQKLGCQPLEQRAIIASKLVEDNSSNNPSHR